MPKIYNIVSKAKLSKEKEERKIKRKMKMAMDNKKKRNNKMPKAGHSLAPSRFFVRLSVSLLNSIARKSEIRVPLKKLHQHHLFYFLHLRNFPPKFTKFRI